MTFAEASLRVQARSANTGKSAESYLNELRYTSESSFDVFLSHSILDAELIVGAKLRLEESGLSVYIDWLNDPYLDRSAVTPSTAARLRFRMLQCRMLVYAHSLNSTLSKWCPWELGFFDGAKGGNVFVMPISSSTSTSFSGQEYLGLYPYLYPSSISSNIWIEGVEGLHFLSEAKTKSFRLKA